MAASRTMAPLAVSGRRSLARTTRNLWPVARAILLLSLPVGVAPGKALSGKVSLPLAGSHCCQGRGISRVGRGGEEVSANLALPVSLPRSRGAAGWRSIEIHLALSLGSTCMGARGSVYDMGSRPGSGAAEAAPSLAPSLPG